MDKKEIDKLIEMGQKQKERNKKQNDYLKTKYDRLNITIPFGSKERVEAAAKLAGKSVNAYCSELIMNHVENDTKVKSDLPDCFK